MPLLPSRLRAASLTLLATCALTLPARQQAQQPAHTPAYTAARLNNLGTALMSQSLLDRASTTFAEAYKTDPSLTLAETNQAIALIYLQRFAEAQPLLEAAARATPSDPHVWYALGLLYRNQNNPQKALASFQKVLTLRPSDPDTHYMVASVDLELKDFPAAAAGFRQAIALEPHHAPPSSASRASSAARATPPQPPPRSPSSSTSAPLNSAPPSPTPTAKKAATATSKTPPSLPPPSPP